MSKAEASTREKRKRLQSVDDLRVPDVRDEVRNKTSKEVGAAYFGHAS